MSRIRSSNTKPEVYFRKALHRLGFRFRLHGRDLHGKPDIILPRYNAVVFVHGCFWHRHAGCKVESVPKSNTEFWLSKFARNVERDVVVRQKLQDQGWRVFVIWECKTDSPKKAELAAKELACLLLNKTTKFWVQDVSSASQ
ncbi:DNA mismatch endonuclease (patch repair protein) [Agrobacterium sp. SORGH_AS 745]|nr:DNA mismatch endonuclease (patch repair protein) [Agrobacterium tumefaciens]MDQ1220326.1 DNA mismatch endonuclease (patch repair protein) [Agrobacterium sp. SORGH_AS_0745]